MYGPANITRLFSPAHQVFEQLRNPIDPKVLEQREKEVNDRINASYEKAERRQHELV